MNIHPTTLESLQATSTFERLSTLLSEGERPDEGWLKDERGTIHFFEADEFEASLWADLWLDQATFDALVHDIKNGVTLRSARLPAALPLFASALAGMGFTGWRRKRQAA